MKRPSTGFKPDNAPAKAPPPAIRPAAAARGISPELFLSSLSKAVGLGHETVCARSYPIDETGKPDPGKCCFPDIRSSFAS